MSILNKIKASNIMQIAAEKYKETRGGLLYSAEYMRRAASGANKVENISKAGISFHKGLKTGIDFGIKGSLMFGIPMAAISSATADRGHKLSSGLGSMTPMLGSLVGGVMGGTPGAILGGLLFDTKIQDMVTEGVQMIREVPEQMERLEMGSDNAQFVNTNEAHTMRQVAARQMSGSLLNARQYLGKEAALLHN